MKLMKMSDYLKLPVFNETVEKYEVGDCFRESITNCSIIQLVTQSFDILRCVQVIPMVGPVFEIDQVGLTHIKTLHGI